MKETERIAIMDNLVAKRIKQKHASRQLGVSPDFCKILDSKIKRLI